MYRHALSCPIPSDTFHPCYCPLCKPRAATNMKALTHPLSEFMPVRISAPRMGESARTSDRMLELMVPLMRRKCLRQDRSHPLLMSNSVPDLATRYNRAYAFLYRCLMTPNDIPAPAAYMAKPQDAFDRHDMDDPGIARVRAALLAPPDGSQPLVVVPGSEPWAISALDAVGVVVSLCGNPPVASLLAEALAAEGAWKDKRTVANPFPPAFIRRAITHVDPFDVWPWAPGWLPATFTPEPTLLSKNTRSDYHFHILDPRLHGWWNLNAIRLRPDLFSAGDRLQHDELVARAMIRSVDFRSRKAARRPTYTYGNGVITA